MKKLILIILVAGLLLAACDLSVPTKPSVTGLCESGTELTPGEEIFLGQTADFGVVLQTHGGADPSATMVIVLSDGQFPASGSVLPKEGQERVMKWGTRVEVTIANCGGRYYYAAVLNEVEEPARDDCSAGFGGPTKPWPFWDEVILFRPGTGEEVWFFNGSQGPALLRLVDGNLVPGSTDIKRPLDGKTTVAFIDLVRGQLVVVVKNCHETLYYKATWLP